MSAIPPPGLAGSVFGFFSNNPEKIRSLRHLARMFAVDEVDLWRELQPLVATGQLAHWPDHLDDEWVYGHPSCSNVPKHTVVINGKVCAGPLRRAPPHGTPIYLPNALMPDRPHLDTWNVDVYDGALKRGFVFTNREAAIAVAGAMTQPLWDFCHAR